MLEHPAKSADEGKQQSQHPAEFEVSDRLQVLHNLIQQYIHQVSTYTMDNTDDCSSLIVMWYSSKYLISLTWSCSEI